MSDFDDGGQVFPKLGPNGQQGRGMTLRDYFAAQAMTGMLANQSTQVDSNDVITALAGVSYDLADAMIKAREQQGA